MKKQLSLNRDLNCETTFEKAYIGSVCKNQNKQLQQQKQRQSAF